MLSPLDFERQQNINTDGVQKSRGYLAQSKIGTGSVLTSGEIPAASG